MEKYNETIKRITNMSPNWNLINNKKNFNSVEYASLAQFRTIGSKQG